MIPRQTEVMIPAPAVHTRVARYTPRWEIHRHPTTNLLERKLREAGPPPLLCRATGKSLNVKYMQADLDLPVPIPLRAGAAGGGKHAPRVDIVLLEGRSPVWCDIGTGTGTSTDTDVLELPFCGEPDPVLPQQGDHDDRPGNGIRDGGGRGHLGLLAAVMTTTQDDA